MVGGALLGAAANRQVCPTISEMTFGNQSNTNCANQREFGAASFAQIREIRVKSRPDLPISFWLVWLVSLVWS
jgi:hypothetical protein